MNDLKKLLHSETFFFVTQYLRFDYNKLFAIVFALFLLFSNWSKPCFTSIFPRSNWPRLSKPHNNLLSLTLLKTIQMHIQPLQKKKVRQTNHMEPNTQTSSFISLIFLLHSLPLPTLSLQRFGETRVCMSFKLQKTSSFCLFFLHNYMPILTLFI
jgi:hypothetical protein